MTHELVQPPKAKPGDRVAVLSPSFGAAGAFPAVHEQAMRRLADLTGLVPVEYPTTREVGASAQARAADINAAFADSSIRGIVAVIGGDDQITVIPHLEPELARRDPKRSSAPATTRTCTIGSGPMASRASTAARLKSTSAPDRRQTTSTYVRFAPHFSPAKPWNSPTRASRRTMAWPGATRGRSPSTGAVSPPNRGAGTARPTA